jgi:hypothetical protein
MQHKEMHTMETYYESAEGITISLRRAYQEMQRHGVECDYDQMVADIANGETVDAQALLVWLGY